MNSERLIANIMIPVMMWEDYWNDTSNAKTLSGLNMCEYERKLDEFVFSEERNYAGFRKFLSEHSVLFEDQYSLVKNLTDEEVDDVFERVGQERMEFYKEAMKYYPVH